MSLLGSIVTILVAEAATSAGLEAGVAPAATAVSRLALSTSKATTCSPFCSRFLAIPLPMLPRPMKPTGPSFAAAEGSRAFQKLSNVKSKQRMCLTYMTCNEVSVTCMLN